MDEQERSRAQGQPEVHDGGGDVQRGVAAVIPDNRGLRYALAALTLAPLVSGWWLIGRSRRRGPMTTVSLFPVLLGVAVMPVLSRLLIGLVEGRPVTLFEVGPLAVFGVALLLFLLLNRPRPPSGERRRR